MIEYCRIGTVWHKVIEFHHTPEGHPEIYIKQLIPWRSATIKQDYGEVFLRQQPRYDSIYHAPEEIKELYKRMKSKKLVKE